MENNPTTFQTPSIPLGSLVTGGARGIGRAIAEVLACRGDQVTILDVDEIAGRAAAGDLATRGHSVKFVRVDVTDLERTAEVIQKVDAETPLGTVVNNAGVLYSAPLLEVTREKFDHVMSVNVRALFFVIQAAARVMKPRRAGCIINIASTSGFRPATILPQAVYSASKAAVCMLTVAAARELSPWGIRVNGVAPGTFDTPMVRSQGDDAMLAEHVRQRVPIGRLGDPMEIGEVVAFLSSPKASFVVGHVLVVDGGKLT